MQVATSRTWQNDFRKIPYLESEKEVLQLSRKYSESEAWGVTKRKWEDAWNKDDGKSQPLERIQKSGLGIWLVLQSDSKNDFWEHPRKTYNQVYGR